MALHARRQECAPSARTADARPRRPMHQSRGQGGPRHSARRCLSGYCLDQGAPSEIRGAHQAQAAQHVSPVQTTCRSRHHQRADGSGTHDALHDGRSPCGWGFADVHRAGTLRRGRSGRGASRRESAGWQFAFRSRWSSAGAPAVRRRIRQANGAATIDEQQTPGSGSCGLAPFDRGARARILIKFNTTCRNPCRIWSALFAPRTKCNRRWT